MIVDVKCFNILDLSFLSEEKAFVQTFHSLLYMSSKLPKLKFTNKRHNINSIGISSKDNVEISSKGIDNVEVSSKGIDNKEIMNLHSPGRIAYDLFGIPKATKANLNNIPTDKLEELCFDKNSGWTVDKHINPLIIELGELIGNIPLKTNKREKCQAILNYKNNAEKGKEKADDDTGGKGKHKLGTNYESFNWRTDTTVSYGGKEWVLQYGADFQQEITKNFDKFLLDNEGTNKMDPSDKNSPFKYQMFVNAYLDPRTPYRSLLGYHGLGSGKTRTLIILSGSFIRHNMKVLILIPGALRNNIYEELYRWGPDGSERPAGRERPDEPNIRIPNYDQLSNEERKKQEKISNRIIANYYDILTYNEGGLYNKLMALTDKTTHKLHDRLVVIDEMHDFISRVTKPNNISRKIYHFLMNKLHNCKILGLSATPLLNKPHELGTLYNILRAPFANGMTLFPESEEEFNEKFVNYIDKSVINENMFKRRISGLTSYYVGVTDRSSMPEVIMHDTFELPFTDHQYRLYLSERYSESKKKSGGGGVGGSGRAGGRAGISSDPNINEGAGSSFRTYSRMVSNFAFPTEIVRPKPISMRDFKTFQKFKDWKITTLDADDLEDEIVDKYVEESPYNDYPVKTLEVAAGINPDPGLEQKGGNGNGREKSKSDDASDDGLDDNGEKVLSSKERALTYIKMLDAAYKYLIDNRKKVLSDANLRKLYSPKMAKLLDVITNGPGSEGLVYIYTEYRILEGVRIVGGILESNGYEKIDYAAIKSFNDLRAMGPAKRYGIISSEEDSVQRKLLLELIRHPENAHGEYIKVVLGTAASSQGISLIGIRQVHILEDYWNLVRNRQVIGRATRFESHLHLPENERNVHVYSYRMVLTTEQQIDIKEKLEDAKEALSTEQYIHNLAMTKDLINNQFLRIIKESAVDAELNYMQNVKLDKDLEIFKIPVDKNRPYVYYPDINNDLNDNEYSKIVKQEEFIAAEKKIGDMVYGYKVSIDGKPLIVDLTHKGKKYKQVIVLYDNEMLKKNIEIIQKLFLLDSKKLIDY